ncbi:hypothetical protein EXIGLDRAFT_781410 [Exidia glandulosa HHB12029]|uniref:Uncharacterized protein n=1 Tax=Exidia glandulosa HHB12029 TaxID=1314781 RepID=A0A165B994_EXIGL|nr:hypothetical protein EXIGLDRAFT_781410 [Exidia glandulosa HHB12029]
MSSFVNKVKSKFADRRRSKGAAPATEPTYSIQPHPAKTNDPSDLARPAPGMPGGGLNQGMQQYPDVAPYAAKGPFIPPPEIAGNLDKPATREELHARTAALNGEN